VWDVETGLYYFRARYFEPELGVFISRDPLGFVDGQSVYQGWFFLKSKGDHSGHVTVEFNGFIGKSHNTFSDASHGWIIAPYVPWDFYMHTDNRNAGEPGTHRIQTKFTLGDCDPGEKAPEITHNVGESSYMILAKDPPNPIIESIEYRTAKPTRANKFPSIDGACVSSGIGQLGVGYPFFKQFTPDIDMETNVSFVLSNGGKTLDLYMVINRDDFPDFEILVNGKLVQSYPAIGDSPIAVFGSTNNEKMVKYSIPVDCPCRCEGKQEPQW
jgi:hypothetical protein